MAISFPNVDKVVRAEETRATPRHASRRSESEKL